jgi:hypothetical protein
MDKILIIGKIIVQLGFFIYDKIKERSRKVASKFIKKK